ncbi:hypothetical protein EJ08DRAFT_666634 [Tothia fuscella]|uniref:Uncharacterized protein n=1 Tax=Tothia fuscella TaxID=1048955 RepID=A0A9P4TSK6_9PEZI|nr:hypothetical protein EJ08DRAFT_666634 [Tothia fuscella]
MRWVKNNYKYRLLPRNGAEEPSRCLENPDKDRAGGEVDDSEPPQPGVVDNASITFNTGVILESPATEQAIGTSNVTNTSPDSDAREKTIEVDITDAPVNSNELDQDMVDIPETLKSLVNDVVSVPASLKPPNKDTADVKSPIKKMKGKDRYIKIGSERVAATGAIAFLSNFHRFNFVVDKYTYETSEHHYQYKKLMFLDRSAAKCRS